MVVVPGGGAAELTWAILWKALSQNLRDEKIFDKEYVIVFVYIYLYLLNVYIY